MAKSIPKIQKTSSNINTKKRKRKERKKREGKN